MITRVSFIIASVVLLLLVIKLCMFQSTSIQKLITSIIFIVIFGTFITVSFVAKKSISYVLLGFTIIITIIGIVAINIVDSEQTNDSEVVESLTMGTNLGTDQTTIGYAREVDSETSTITTNATPVQWLQAQTDTAAQQYENLDKLEDAITGQIGSDPQQGICYTKSGEPGQRTLNSDGCVPLDQELPQCSEEEAAVTTTETGEEQGICVPSATSMGCYDCNIDFDEQCRIVNGEDYGMKSVEECNSPYQDKCKATCGLYYINGQQLDSDSFLTPCYDKNIDLNIICKSMANENNYSNFQKFGVYKYEKCPRRDQRRAICKQYYESTYPTHPLNATACVNENQMDSLSALCKAKDDSYVSYNIGAYDCPMGTSKSKLWNRISSKYNKSIIL